MSAVRPAAAARAMASSPLWTYEFSLLLLSVRPLFLPEEAESSCFFSSSFTLPLPALWCEDTSDFRYLV